MTELVRPSTVHYGRSLKGEADSDVSPLSPFPPQLWKLDLTPDPENAASASMELHQPSLGDPSPDDPSSAGSLPSIEAV